MSEYTRTVLSELHVATIGSVGCGAVSHVRSSEGGVRSDRREMCGSAIVRGLEVGDGGEISGVKWNVGLRTIR